VICTINQDFNNKNWLNSKKYFNPEQKLIGFLQINSKYLLDIKNLKI